MTPANNPKTGIAAAPYFVTTGIKTTVIAPVGPLTWYLDPPKRAAINPAIIAVVNPDAALNPEVIPKPIARGSATIATVRPAKKSVVTSWGVLENSFLCGRKLNIMQ